TPPTESLSALRFPARRPSRQPDPDAATAARIPRHRHATPAIRPDPPGSTIRRFRVPSSRSNQSVRPHPAPGYRHAVLHSVHNSCRVPFFGVYVRGEAVTHGGKKSRRQTNTILVDNNPACLVQLADALLERRLADAEVGKNIFRRTLVAQRQETLMGLQPGNNFFRQLVTFGRTRCVQ